MVVELFEDDNKPLYSIGDRVLITNPIDFFADDDRTVYEVADIKFSEKYAVYAYKLIGGTTWVNESWLEPDIFGPQIISEDESAKPSGKQAILAELDYELASLHDAIVQCDDAEKERSKRRLAEIRVELLAERAQ